MKVGHFVPYLEPMDCVPMLLSLLKYRSEAGADQFVVVGESGPQTMAVLETGAQLFIEPDLKSAVGVLAGADVINVHCPTEEWGARLFGHVQKANKPSAFTIYGQQFLRTQIPARCICVTPSVYYSQPSSIGASDLVELGVDLEAVTPACGNRSAIVDTIARVGRGWRHKESFWWAMADILARHPRVCIEIAGGDGAGTQRVRAVSASETLSDVLARADILVATPDTGEGSVTYGLMVAMAMGVPAVLTDMVDLRGLAVDGDTALVVPDGDTAALVLAVESLLRDESLRCRLSAGAREHALSHFDVRHRVPQYEAIYADLLAVGRPAAAHPVPKGGARLARAARWRDHFNSACVALRNRRPAHANRPEV